MALRSLAIVALVLTLAKATDAAEPSDAEARLKAMMQRAASLKIEFAADKVRKPPELLPSPILRCNDPTREEEDGTVWLWADGKRPVACLCLFFIRDQWAFEHVALSGEALKVSGRSAWSWTPKAEDRLWIPLKDAVPDSSASRQRTARDIARQMDASEFHMDETYRLRLLERPLYTYSDVDQGVVEGMLFAFAYGTNPEILLQLQARQSGEERPQWQAAFARLSSAEITVKLDDREIWKAPAVREFDARESYYSASERDETK
jgi:hypothetical protein